MFTSRCSSLESKDSQFEKARTDKSCTLHWNAHSTDILNVVFSKQPSCNTVKNSVKSAIGNKVNYLIMGDWMMDVKRCHQTVGKNTIKDQIKDFFEGSY